MYCITGGDIFAQIRTFILKVAVSSFWWFLHHRQMCFIACTQQQAVIKSPESQLTSQTIVACLQAQPHRESLIIS